jgi:hypothetical protein
VSQFIRPKFSTLEAQLLSSGMSKALVNQELTEAERQIFEKWSVRFYQILVENQIKAEVRTRILGLGSGQDSQLLE